ncbi:MAG: Ig-like domain-containing protein, partial [Verrucomicrobiales bacterium]|nr:Ig-like domain-containing protein [Verrucomicrobiales bacterium]
MQPTATVLRCRAIIGLTAVICGVASSNAAAPRIVAHSPAGHVDAADITGMTLTLDAPVVAADAQSPSTYEFLDLGADHQPGGGDDLVMLVQPTYVSGGTEIDLLFVGDTQVDLSQWVERDYASGGSGDWRIETGGTSVKQYINGNPTYFVSDFDFIDREFVGRIKVETTGDDDFIGLVFGFTVNGSNKPDSYYLFDWKQATQDVAERGFKLLKITNSNGTAPDLWNGETGGTVTVLARDSSVGWADNTEYDFSVRYRSSGQIDLAIRRSSDQALLWSTSVTDPSPLGVGKVGFYNYSQSLVRYSGLNQVDFLEEGAYQLTAYSGNPGLRGTDGTFLDGNGDGTLQADDDFVTTLVIDHSDPVVTEASIQPAGIAVEFYDLGGIDLTTVENPANYTVTASGGDGVLGNGNDVVLTVAGVTSSTVGATTTATLDLGGPLGDDRYHLVVDGSASVQDLAGHKLAGGDYETDLELVTGPAVITLDLLATSDSGASDRDELTNDATPTLAVDVNKAGWVELDVDGDLVADHTSWATGPGTFEFTAATLTDGDYTATAWLTPAVGSPVNSSLGLTIDTQGPFVLPGAAEEQAPLFARTLTFSELLDEATIDPLQVTMTGPNGANVPLLAVNGSGAVYTLEFAAITLPGDYHIDGHLDISDLAGNPSNQDQDGTSGEAGVDVPHDSFLLLADVTSPYVTRFEPSGVVNQDVTLFEVEFSEAMDAASFSGDDVSLLTPGGPVDPSQMTVTPVDSRVFQVSVPTLSAEGQYDVTVGPTIRDLAGNTMTELFLVDDQSFDTLPASWVFHGDASWNAGGFARITPAAGYRVGAAYFGTAQTPAPFIVEFDFNLSSGGGSGGGADGLVFVCAENPVLGGSGGGIGYSGALGTSFAVEFDTYNNGGVDPNNNHVAFDWNGQFRSTARVVNGSWMVNSGTHHAVIRFDGASRIDLTLTGPGGAVTDASYDLPPEAIPSQYTFGFTSGTGGGWANHDVDNVQVHLLTGGASGAFATSFVIDKTGPAVVDMTPSGDLPGAVDHVDLTFDSPILPGSFGVADVQLTGPAGAVASVANLGGNGDVFRINFNPALNAIGDYQIQVGPEVTDLAGNPMNQNGNGTNGEDPADAFVGNLALTLPDLQITQISAP